MRESLERNERSGEEGSAYIIALLVLIVLTAMGLSLALITSTEMQVGSNERTVQRAFYSGDAGIGMAAARVIVNQDYSEGILMLNETPTGDPAGALVRSSVELAPTAVLMTAPCNYCEINDQGGYEATYERVIAAVTARGRRSGIVDTGAIVSERTVAAILDVQPLASPPNIGLLPLERYTAGELADRIKF